MQTTVVRFSSSCTTFQTKISRVRRATIVATSNPDKVLVHEGDRIAQLILERIYTPQVLEVDVRLHRYYRDVRNVFMC